MSEEVTISKSEYERLLDAEQRLDCLYACGVDSWEGYEYALELFNES
jgi:hypothetical protein